MPLLDSGKIDGCVGQLAETLEIGVKHATRALLVAREQQKHVGAGDSARVKDGEGRRTRSAHHHALALEGHTRKLQELDAPIAIGVETDQLIVLADEHVGALRQLRASCFARCSLEGQRLIGSGDVHGQEIPRIQKGAGIVQLDVIGKGIGPRQTQPFV